MKKPIFIIALFAFLATGAFAQFSQFTPYSLRGQVYFPGNTYKYYPRHTVNSGRGYRSLRLQMKSEIPIDDTGSMQILHADLPGDPNIIEIEVLRDRPDPNARQWKVGEKTTVEQFEKDHTNVSGYRIRTPGSGYYVEFYGLGTVGRYIVDEIVDNRKFGVIMPNSEVRVTSSGALMWIEHGAIGWDDEFMYANNFDQFMDYLTKYVSYDLIKSEGAKARFDRKTDEEKRDYCENLVLAIATGEGVWGGIWGAFPPYLMPIEFANVLAQFVAQANMAAHIGYLYGHYPEGGDAFKQQLKLDNYMLFAENTPGELTSDTFWGMVGTARDETLQRATIWLVTKYAPKALDFTVRSVPIVGTIWGVGKGTYDGFNDAKKMGTRAIAYYKQDKSAFSFDSLAYKITRYNYDADAVIIPARIDNNEVRFIDSEVFNNNKTLKRVTLGRYVRKIETLAFANCEALETIYLGRSVTEIGDYAFSYCPSLTTVFIPSTIRKITFGENAFEGTLLNHPTKVRLRQLGYTGEGVGPGFFVTNNTGAAIAVVEVKHGEGWSQVLTRNVRNGQTVEVSLAPGTYDIRVRTAAKYPGGETFQKKAVVVTDDTQITFLAGDYNGLAREDYQAFIQSRCLFTDPAAVWRAMDTHDSADSLYRVWAESYPNLTYRKYPYPRPPNKTDQEIIQAQCRFTSEQGVWDAAAEHTNPAALLKTWADSYYKDDGFLGGVVGIIRVVKDIIPGGNDGVIPERMLSLDGVWRQGDQVVTISGSTGAFTRLGSLNDLAVDAVNKGLLNAGDDFFRNLSKTGDLTWRGQTISVQFYKSRPTEAVSIGYVACTIVMAVDGQSFVHTATYGSTGEKIRSYYRQR